MQRVIRAMAALVILAQVAPAGATEFWHTSHLLRIHPLADGSIILMFTSDGTDCPSTSSPKQYRVVVGQNGITADGLRSIQATAMTALATGVRLQVAFDDGSTNCYVNRAIIRE